MAAAFGQAPARPLPEHPRMPAAFTVTALVDAALAVVLTQAGQGTSPAACVAYTVVSAAGLWFGTTRADPRGVRLADLNRSRPCANMQLGEGLGDPAAGFVCLGYGYPPVGRDLVATALPSGRVVLLCPACSVAVSPAPAPVRVDVEVVTAPEPAAISAATPLHALAAFVGASGIGVGHWRHPNPQVEANRGSATPDDHVRIHFDGPAGLDWFWDVSAPLHRPGVGGPGPWVRHEAYVGHGSGDDEWVEWVGFVAFPGDQLAAIARLVHAGMTHPRTAIAAPAAGQVA